MRSPGDHVWAIANTSRKEKSEDIGTVNRLVLQPQNGWTTAEVRSEQLKDSDIVQILEAKENGDQRPCLQEVSDKSPGLKALWAQWDSLIVENGLLKRAWESVDGKAAGSAQVPSEGGPARNPW
jgi:hypothetical protein